MEWLRTEKRQAAGTELRLSICRIGEDLLAVLEGGSRPHIGCAVQAVARPSLKNDGSRGATASVLNLTGHKDEYLCRKVAEQLCIAYGVTVVCTGGVHLEDITRKQIKEIAEAIDEMIDLLIFNVKNKEYTDKMI